MNPYRIEGPTLISFSGGRTSAFMLREILEAHGGQLPPDTVVTFANTGKEREQTLRFVHECETRWSVKVHWLERADWRGRGTPQADRVVEVGYNSAARAGEPFKALIDKKGYLPNAVTRFCTQELKILTMAAFCRSMGWKRWTSMVGLRRDEGHRIIKGIMRNESNKEPWRSIWPLDRAGVVRADVMRFWLGPKAAFPSDTLPQGFDLGLAPWEGNCDHCFLKGAEVLTYQMATRPGSEDWWIEREHDVTKARKATSSGARWVTEYSYERLREVARTQGDLFLEPPPMDDYDVECGLACGA